MTFLLSRWQVPRSARRSSRLPICVVALVTLFLAFMVLSPRPASAADWNDAIQWRPWPEALDEAKQDHKPICLVFYTNSCVHCRHYSRVFHAPNVVAASRRFVMVRVNQNDYPFLSRKFAVDGEYVPRTYFLSADGALDPRIHARRSQYKYFYDEDDPTSLLSAMRVASRASAR